MSAPRVGALLTASLSACPTSDSDATAKLLLLMYFSSTARLPVCVSERAREREPLFRLY